MRDLLPLRDLLIALSPSLSGNGNHSSTFRTTFHDDNSGALSLAHLEPGRVTSRSKHYAVKRRYIGSEGSLILMDRTKSKWFKSQPIFKELTFLQRDSPRSGFKQSGNCCVVGESCHASFYYNLRGNFY
jgi:hypothetical protein